MTIDFSQMWLFEFYAMQNAAVAEMKVREDTLIKQAKVANKRVNKMKQTVQETKQKVKTWDENR